MRMVHLKVMSQTPQHLKSKVTCTNIVWVLLIGEQCMSIVLQILEAYNKINQDENPFLKYMNRGLTILTEGFLILA
jgi:hypothetical protein